MLINTARGGIYQTEALADALQVRQGRRRGDRRVRGRAVHRLAAHRVRQRHPHPAPGRVDRRGAGPRRRADRRVRRCRPRAASMVPTAVNIAPVSPEVLEKVGPYIDARRGPRQHGRADRARRHRRARRRVRRRARRRRHAHPAHRRAQGPAHASSAPSRSTSSTPTTTPSSAASSVTETKRPETHDYVSMIIVRAHDAAAARSRSAPRSSARRTSRAS